MERSIQDESRIIRTNCHVLRNVQQPSNISNNDEHNIRTTHRQKPNTGLHGQHSHPCSNKEIITQNNERSTQDTSGVMNIEWDYNYYQPWSDNERLVDEMLAMLDEDIIMQ